MGEEHELTMFWKSPVLLLRFNSANLLLWDLPERSFSKVRRQVSFLKHTYLIYVDHEDDRGF